MSERGSLNSLLKYRFNKPKRSFEKLSHTAHSDDSDTSAAANKNGDGDEQSAVIPSLASCDSGASDTAVDQQFDSHTSPVFNKKFVQSKCAGKDVSQSNCASKDISQSQCAGKDISQSKFAGKDEPQSNFGDNFSQTKESSAWLSKIHGITANGHQNSKCKKKDKFRRVRTYTTSDSEGETDVAVMAPEEQTNQHAKASLWQQQLRSMFPASTGQQIQAAVAEALKAGNLEQGVDYMVQGHASVKRRQRESSEDENISHGNSFKRIRIMPSDSQDSETTLPPSQPDSQHLKDSQRTESYSLSSQRTESYSYNSQHTESYSVAHTEERGIEFLRGAFPALPRERLVQVLRDCHNNTDQAVAMLSSQLSEAERRVEDLPSTARGTRSSNNVHHEVLALSDEEEYDEEEDEDSDDSVDEDRNTSKQELILSFLEEATMAELLMLPGCSRKKAEALVELRPFGSWEKLMETLETSKQLSYSLVHGCYEIIQLRNVVVRLMKQCEQISSQMELVVSKLTGRLQGPAEDQITTQPKLLNTQFELKPYQLIGLNWLRIMHSQQLNGILADEMGLGKTIQAIAFLAYLLEEGEEGPHVIIVPSSTIENWLRELAAWCPALGVIVYYGSQEERRATRHSIMYEGRDDFHVLLTTYNMATGSVEDRSLFKKFQFHYAVFDEGHMLKNMSSLRFQNLMKISAERRLLLTGTPLQNNLLELMSLLCFVMPDIFQGKTEPLKKMFSMISKSDNEQGKYEKERIAQAQRIMRPFVLRRLKKDVLTQLPKKEEEVRLCPLLADQQALYNRLLRKFSQQVERDVVTEPGGGMAMFMQLRKVANHPLLVRNHYDDQRLMQMATALAKEPSHRDRGALPRLIMEDMAQMNDFDLIALCRQYKKYLGKYELDPAWIKESGKFHQLDNLLPTMKKQDDRVLLFSQFTMMLDIVEVYLQQKNIHYLRLDGSTPVPDRQRLIDQFNEQPDIFIFLLSTRAGGLGINLTAANTIILHDIDFNPYNDKQAEDRCHRLGQKRTVKIVRLIARNTVEEGMLRIAQAKLRLEQDVTAVSEAADEAQADVVMLLREAVSKVKKAESSTSVSSTVPSPSVTS